VRDGKVDGTSDFTARGLGELKAWLEPWFLPKIKRGGGGGGGPANLIAFWGGTLPLIVGPNLVWRVPFDADGTSQNYTFTRAFARMETAYSGPISFQFQKSSPPGVYSATTLTTVTIAAGNYQNENTGLAVTASSGDLLRLYFSAVGIVTQFSCELVGSHA